MASLRVKRVINTFQKIYPQALADSSWDNTGLLLESPELNNVSQALKVLLTIDLTTNVVDEAISRNSNLIISYHPIIFRPLKSITFSDTQQASLVRLVQKGISVYCPHTAIDARKGGVNDWLADGVSGGRQNETSRIYIENVSNVEDHPDAGMGRRIELKEKIGLEILIERIKKALKISHLQIALPNNLEKLSQHKIESVAICAGSGGSILRKAKADVWFTGELSHHEALAATEKGIIVITCGHSNTERGFLQDVLQPQLETAFKEAEINNVEVLISKADKDPYEFY